MNGRHFEGVASIWMTVLPISLAENLITFWTPSLITKTNRDLKSFCLNAKERLSNIVLVKLT